MKTMLYLAMTAPELSQFHNPAGCAYMACHFSPYGQGLSGLPDSLAENSMIILNDRIPFLHHNCPLIAAQLNSLPCDSLLLDFENMESDAANELIHEILSTVKVPVGVSAKYASAHSCAVFVGPMDADCDPFAAIRHWNNREIWLDLSPGCVCCRVTAQGCNRMKEAFPPRAGMHHDSKLFCHYSIELKDAEAIFHLHREWDDARGIVEEGKSIGITRGIGLFQEWHRFLPDYGNK